MRGEVNRILEHRTCVLEALEKSEEGVTEVVKTSRFVRVTTSGTNGTPQSRRSANFVRTHFPSQRRGISHWDGPTPFDDRLTGGVQRAGATKLRPSTREGMPMERNKRTEGKQTEKKRGSWWVGRKRAQRIKERERRRRGGGTRHVNTCLRVLRLSTSEPENPHPPSTCRRRLMLTFRARDVTGEKEERVLC